MKDERSNKILTSVSSFAQLSTKPLELLNERGYEVTLNPYGRKLNQNELIELARSCVGIVAGLEDYSAEIIDSLPKLKCISRVGIGIDSIDIDYANSKGVIVKNTPDGPTRSVAELTLGLCLSMIRKIPNADRNIRDNNWQKEPGFLLHEKTVGIIGIGRIGKLVSQLFLGFGCKVIACDLNPDHAWASSFGVEIVEIEELLNRSNVISLHVPYDKTTNCLIGKKEFGMMRADAFILNLSRGGIVDEKELYAVLSGKKILGAALDVFSDEPYFGELTELDNIILTPHYASYAQETKICMEMQAVNNLLNSLQGIGE